MNLDALPPREESKRLRALLAIGLVLSTTVPILAEISSMSAKANIMKSQRQYHTLTLLAKGQVLAAGGGLTSAELYSPAVGARAVTGEHEYPLLVSSGQNFSRTVRSNSLSCAELYTPQLQK
jgi:hypothetical protein